MLDVYVVDKQVFDEAFKKLTEQPWGDVQNLIGRLQRGAQLMPPEEFDALVEIQKKKAKEAEDQAKKAHKD